MNELATRLEERATRGEHRGARAVFANVAAQIEHDKAPVEMAIPEHPRRRLFAVAGGLAILLVLGAIAWGVGLDNDEHSRVTTSPSDTSTPEPRNVCDYIASADLERLGVSKSLPSNDPTECSYIGEAANVGDPEPTLRITVRKQSETGDTLPTSGGDVTSQAVSGLGAPAVWVTTRRNGNTSTDSGETAITAPLGTPYATSGKLVVLPASYRLEVATSGMYNNIEEAKLAAQLVLAQL